MSGTVNVSRSIWHDTAFKDEPFTEREAFIWIIMEASYKAREKRIGNIVVSLDRGQLATSIRFMCEAWSWSKSRVDRFLKRLENRDMIGTHSGTGINVITVCKYEEYQNKPSGSGTLNPKKRDSSGTAAGQQRDKPNKGLIPEEIPEATSTQEVEAYQNYLEIHPKPVESVAGERAWCALIEAGEDPQVIIGAARAYAKAVESWSAEGKVQRSDNFLATKRGKWREYRSQTDKSEVAAMSRDAKRIREHDAATAGPIKFHPEIAKILISKQFITTQEAKEAGIQI